jgi:hypothetical protein
MSRHVNIVLTRGVFALTYTSGSVSVDGVPVAGTLEYPWRANQRWIGKCKRYNTPRISCIREGIYHGTLVTHVSDNGAPSLRVSIDGVAGRGGARRHSVP